ncbi:MAG: Crp/Fnr family transcriptional regulator [Lachnospiraceae bacterium]|nr:Crp/Fnr family transcriptional regulator [Lachnospiraceae bacterium]
MNETYTYDEYSSIIKNCTLFNGVDNSHFEDILNSLHAKVISYKRGNTIQQIGEPFLYAYYVLDGEIAASFFSEDYDEVNMNHFLPGNLVGEALACSDSPLTSPIQITAIDDCHILQLDISSLTDPESEKFNGKEYIVSNLLQILAQRNYFLTTKIRILSQKSIRERILLYLSSLPKGIDNAVSIPFSKTTLAQFLNVNRSALSREFSRMEFDGVITVKGKRIKINTND